MQLAQSWKSPPRELELKSSDVHLWLITVPTELDSLENYRERLAGDERDRADRFHFAQDRARFTLGRAVLRQLLARYLARDDFKLAANQHGKPYVVEPSGAIEFNVAHSGDLVLLGFTRGRIIGVDVERIRPDFATTEIAKRFFAPDEAAIVTALPEPDRAQGFFNCWTRKEAYIKAHGLGLSLPLHSFSVAFTADEPPALLRVADDRAAPKRWTMIDLPTCDGYAAATTFEGRDLKIAQFQWGRGGGG
jgi:4'-phosphopantetheinyl transferase